jgi:hypothetical protein
MAKSKYKAGAKKIPTLGKALHFLEKQNGIFSWDDYGSHAMSMHPTRKRYRENIATWQGKYTLAPDLFGAVCTNSAVKLAVIVPIGMDPFMVAYWPGNKLVEQWIVTRMGNIFQWAGRENKPELIDAEIPSPMSYDNAVNELHDWVRPE